MPPFSSLTTEDTVARRVESCAVRINIQSSLLGQENNSVRLFCEAMVSFSQAGIRYTVSIHANNGVR